MKNLNVAVLGASKFGRFHAYRLNSLGCNVRAILGSTEESAQKTAEMLRTNYGISPKPYHDIDEMLREDLHAVSISTVPSLHEKIIGKCLEAGLHVLCEKPLIQTDDDLSNARRLFNLARARNRILTMNTQWPSLFRYFEVPEKIERFSITMEPGVRGEAVLYDHLPHTNSILVRLIPMGKATNIRFPKKEQEENIVQFTYANKDYTSDVEYRLNFKDGGPRRMAFTINETDYERLVGENYDDQYLVSSRKQKIEDPLLVSIRRFIDSVSGLGKPLNTEQNIMENIALQEEIIRIYRR